MNKTVTFQDVNNKVTFVTKEEFLNTCPTPEKFTILELNRDYNMLTFLHNEAGPALVRGPLEEFWLDGRCISVSDPELAKRIKHQSGFNNKFEELLGDKS